MSAWYIGSKEVSGVYAARSSMKCDPAECDDLGKELLVEFLKSEGRWNDEVCGAEEREYIYVDGGGMVRLNEPEVAWEANGCKIKTRVRVLPFLISRFEDLKPVPEIPRLVGFGGFCRQYFLSPKTVEGSLETMRRLLKGTESLRQEVEMDIHKTLNEHGNAASLRKCGCMSGKMYGDCCGKFIESKEHRELRRAIDES